MSFKFLKISGRLDRGKPPIRPQYKPCSCAYGTLLEVKSFSTCIMPLRSGTFNYNTPQAHVQSCWLFNFSKQDDDTRIGTQVRYDTDCNILNYTLDYLLTGKFSKQYVPHRSSSKVFKHDTTSCHERCFRSNEAQNNSRRYNTTTI